MFVDSFSSARSVLESVGPINPPGQKYHDGSDDYSRHESDNNVPNAYCPPNPGECSRQSLRNPLPNGSNFLCHPRIISE